MSDISIQYSDIVPQRQGQFSIWTKNFHPLYKALLKINGLCWYEWQSFTS